MGFNADLADMAASIDAELGEPAVWSGVADPVQVQMDDHDEVGGFGESQAILRSRVLTVHRSAVPAPAVGDTATLVEGGEVWRVLAQPLIDRDGYWACQVAPVVA